MSRSQIVYSQKWYISIKQSSQKHCPSRRCFPNRRLRLASRVLISQSSPLTCITGPVKFLRPQTKYHKAEIDVTPANTTVHLRNLCQYRNEVDDWMGKGRGRKIERDGGGMQLQGHKHQVPLHETS